ncbi:MAG: patatin-like phospholipase family protein [Azospirillaceae bacterium]|nr:patatin-like phospholipase family protein [Azospirillaceae bacterium]
MDATQVCGEAVGTVGLRDYKITAMVLQGGGALGSYQAGVYQGLAEAGIHPNWVAGISIGALNAAVIAGNPPEQRVEKLDAFWRHICRPPVLPPITPFGERTPPRQLPELPTFLRSWLDALEASRALLEGQNGFFVPRAWPALAIPQDRPDKASFYDTGLLRRTLEQFADFDRINRSAEMRVSVGAVNIRTGNFSFFDNTTTVLKPEHFMASGALPPGFPAVEIEAGEFYWDGGLVSNTPLAHVLADTPRRDALIFQIDLWSASGPIPDTLAKVATRQKDIQYSSRTRLVTDLMAEQQRFRHLLQDVLDLVPEDARNHPAVLEAREQSCDARRSLIHLIYRDKPYEGNTKDFQFGALTMREHWDSGLTDIRDTLKRCDWPTRPSGDEPFRTFDIHRIRGD